jgi:hypothetical protein
MISESQTILNIETDWNAGSDTWRSNYSYINNPYITGNLLAKLIDYVDLRNEKLIATLMPETPAHHQTHGFENHKLQYQNQVHQQPKNQAEQDELYTHSRIKGVMVINPRVTYSQLITLSSCPCPIYKQKFLSILCAYLI